MPPRPVAVAMAQMVSASSLIMQSILFSGKVPNGYQRRMLVGIVLQALFAIVGSISFW